LAAKTQLAQLEKELIGVAAESVRAKEQKKKDGEYNENAYTRENRWQSYLDEKERKAQDEIKSKENSMFKEYHEMFDKKDVSESQMKCNLMIRKSRQLCTTRMDK
jgi:hypothetical protein